MEFLTPEELAEHLDRSHMAMEDRSRSITRMFDELDKDHMLALASIFNTIAASDSAGRVGAYYEGVVRTKIEGRFGNICITHGVNHDEEELAAVTEGSTTTRDSDEAVDVDELETARLMKLYRLEIKNGELQCSDCGLPYQSLQDRMVKEPDDCHGCHLRSAHG